MENRDNHIFNIRPQVKVAPAKHPIEQFQNKTLRPILKFQNELILQICRMQFIKRKEIYFGLSSAKQLEYIQHQVIQDKNFKNLLIGSIIGFFTKDEFKFYQNHQHEARKRLTNLLIQRIQDQQGKIDIQ